MCIHFRAKNFSLLIPPSTNSIFRLVFWIFFSIFCNYMDFTELGTKFKAGSQPVRILFLFGFILQWLEFVSLILCVYFVYIPWFSLKNCWRVTCCVSFPSCFQLTWHIVYLTGCSLLLYIYQYISLYVFFSSDK